MKTQILAAGLLALTAGAALADGDAAKGATVAKACQACHSLTEKTIKVGPYLVGVVGRKVASVENYAYSDAMLEFAKTHDVWDAATLNTYLQAPMSVVHGTKMSFGGVKKDDQRADLIAYLTTLK